MSERDANEVLVVGELDEAPELRTTRAGTKVANPTVVTTRSYTDRGGQEQEATEYHRVVCWGGLAQRAADSADGARVKVSGRLQTRTWQDDDGRKRATTEIVADSFEVVETPDDAGSGFTEEALLGDDADDSLPF